MAAQARAKEDLTGREWSELQGGERESCREESKGLPKEPVGGIGPSLQRWAWLSKEVRRARTKQEG